MKTQDDMRTGIRRMFALAILLLCVMATAKSQNTFLKTYGGKFDEVMHRMIRSHDGGFMMAGSTESFGQGNIGTTDDYIVKTDSEGNILWSRTLGLQTYDDVYWIEPTTDSAYVICGVASDNYSIIGILVAKISESGDILWQKVIQRVQAEFGYCIRQTTDGGFIIAAETISDNDDIDFLLIKTDADATVQWSKEIGGLDSDVPQYILQTADGGYLTSGISRYGFFWLHMYTVKTDSDGNVEWEKSYNTFPYFSKCTVSSILATSDGGYLIGGGSTRNQPLSDIILLKIDSAGTIQWTKAYGGDDAEYCGSIIETESGYYVVCGETASSTAIGYYDGLVMLIDDTGNLINSAVFGEINADDEFVSVLPLDDGGYMLGGTTSSYNVFQHSDFMMVKIDKNFNGPVCDTLTPNILETDVSFGDTTDVDEWDVTVSDSDVTAVIDSGVNDSLLCDVVTGAVFPPATHDDFRVYPSPTSGNCVLSFKDVSVFKSPVTIQIANAQGQIVYSAKEVFSDNESEKELFLPRLLPSGIYTVQIIGTERIYKTKLVVQREE